MKLTDAKLRTLTDPGKHFDGGGLYLEVTKAGGRYWRMKYRHGGKEKRLAFGVYPAVSLKDAREKAEAARKLLQAGGQRVKAAGVPPFLGAEQAAGYLQGGVGTHAGRLVEQQDAIQAAELNSGHDRYG